MDKYTHWSEQVHTQPPSLLLSNLLRESGLQATYATQSDEAAEGQAVARFLRWLAMLEQLPALRGGGASEWAPAPFLVPYIHSLKEAGEEPRWEPTEGTEQVTWKSCMTDISIRFLCAHYG